MAKLYDAVVTLGTYSSNGETKYVSRNIGSVIETRNGLALVMDASFNPAGAQRTEDGKVWVKLFEPRTEEAESPPPPPAARRGAPAPPKRSRQTSAAPAADFPDDDIPF